MLNKLTTSGVIPLFCLAMLWGPASSLNVEAQAVKEGEVSSPDDAEKVYRMDYHVVFQPAEGFVTVTIAIRQPRRFLREVQFTADPSRYLSITSDGSIEQVGNKVTWLPTKSGGTLSFQLILDHYRSGDGYDSMMAEDWAVFRGDDLLPPVKTRAVKGSESQARLKLSGPKGWSFITAYQKSAKGSGWLDIDRPDRKFDRPVGWMAAGNLGIRWDDIDDTRVAIAGPTGQGIRRMDMTAFLRWNLPTLREIFPKFPNRILIVSAADPMWRGGLSGPNSLFIHADRPLISANGTSTLLHELVHVAQPYPAVAGSDWIIESIAEYYSLEIMRRSGTISNRRYELGLEKLESWSSEAEQLEAEESSGSRTAKGVAVMHALDSELKEISGGKLSLDNVVQQLCEQESTISLEELRQTAETLAGEPLGSLPSKGTSY